MFCKEIQDKILRFIDNDIKDKELEDFLKHINECQSCKEELEIYYSLLNGCKQLNSDLEVPDDFHESLMDKIRTSEKTIKKQKQRVAIKRYVGAVAAVFAFVVAIQGFTLLGDVKKKDKSLNMTRISTDNAEQDKSDQLTNNDDIFNLPVLETATQEVEINSFTSDQVDQEGIVQYEATNQPDEVIFDSAKQSEEGNDNVIKKADLSDTAESTYTEEKSYLGLYLGAFMISASIIAGAIFFLKVRK